jgi:hypothetical protein
VQVRRPPARILLRKPANCDEDTPIRAECDRDRGPSLIPPVGPGDDLAMSQKLEELRHEARQARQHEIT